MKMGFIAPGGSAAKKPPHGQPCNGCGLCCMGSLCPLAAWVFEGDRHGGHHEGPCPALERNGAGFACGLITNPATHALAHTLRAGGARRASEAAALLNGAGSGCDARINGEPGDQAFYDRMLRFDRAHRREIRAAKKIWGVP
jgi:hypothetical protein